MAHLIRPLAASDRAQWNGLWAGYLSFYETELDARVSDITFARLIDPQSALFALVAEADGALVGLTHCVLHPATWDAADYCYLEDLFVAPAARGQGVGRTLIEAVYAHADARGCARVYWHTHESNTGAQALYDRLATKSGFIVYRR
jgi:ribosomal protein S18 acetylase RimI-like enzyme